MAPAEDAIDYRILYLEEKRKARQRNKGNDVKTSSETRTEADDSTNLSHQLPEWRGPSSPLQVPVLDRTSDCVSSHDPSSIFYKDTFLSAQFCKDLWQWLEKLPLAATAKTQHPGHWHNLLHSKRRVAVFDGTFPAPLQCLVQALISGGVFDETAPPNHILINHYTPSQGIMPHTDGPVYFSRTATLSLGDGQVLLHFEPRQKGAFAQQQLLLRGDSLVVFEGDAYSQYMHSILETNEEYETADSTCCNAPAGTIAHRQERMTRENNRFRDRADALRRQRVRAKLGIAQECRPSCVDDLPIRTRMTQDD